MSYMVVDLETFDPNLTQMGSGVYRRDGYILGAAVYQKDVIKKYIPLVGEHKATGTAELRELLSTSVTKVGANFIYDVDWIQNWLGVKVNGRLEDVQSRECLLNAYARTYSLDSIAKGYGLEGKKDQEIIEYCRAHGWLGIPQTHLYKMPIDIVARYALGDVEITAEVFERQQALLEAQGLITVLDLETGIMPLLVDMKGNGIRVDEQKRQAVSDQLISEYNTSKRVFEQKYGVCNENSGSDLKKIFLKEGILLSTTEKGNPSFKSEVLNALVHPIGKEIIDLRTLRILVNNFVEGSLVEHQINGRIHATFYPMKQDEGGTVTGRFACADPNLQQIPAKKEKRGDLIRDIFIPEENCLYGAPDYSQIEYRLLVHFATGIGADEVRRRFNDDPETDYHQYVMDMTGLDRKHAKNFNFGTVYCMGKKTMQHKFGFTPEQCDALTKQYYDAMPFIKPTRNLIINTAKKRSYVKTILGRRARVSDEIRQYDAYYKLVNYLIQGSAADIMKLGMLRAYQAGVFDVLVPHITVHDELGLSIPKTKMGFEAYHECTRLMRECVQLDVPLKVDDDIGVSWGNMLEKPDWSTLPQGFIRSKDPKVKGEIVL